jgi:hypothetical protein
MHLACPSCGSASLQPAGNLRRHGAARCIRVAAVDEAPELVGGSGHVALALVCRDCGDPATVMLTPRDPRMPFPGARSRVGAF